MKRRGLLGALGAVVLLGPAAPLMAHERRVGQAGKAGPKQLVEAPRTVRMAKDLPAGEIHVDPNRFRLFWTLGNRRALSYPVGIGRPGRYEAGEFRVGAKRKWPSWRPTRAMIAREPERYARYADGVPGGPDNPLGARALYLYYPKGGDSYLRIHGTNDPTSIGRRVSAGCVRLLNAHVIDLYDRVPLGTRVVLYPFASV